MKIELPKISIVTVNYNKGAFLEHTIKSVLDQNYPNLEYIIIDGASTDNSVNVIKKYAHRLSYWVTESDNGMTHALQKGFQRATGEIYAWLNSDDMYCQNTLFNVAKSYFTNKWDFFYGDMVFIDVNGKRTKRIYSLDFNYRFYAHGALSIAQPSCFWSSYIYKEVNGVDKNYKLRMDAHLFLKILSSERVKVLRTNEILSKFRIHDGQSHSWSTKEEYLKEIEILKNKFPISLSSKLLIKFKLYKIWIVCKRIFNS